jgi:UDP-glucose:(heptosyl)LPS alpha-1,3-glucosyltransferase
VRIALVIGDYDAHGGGAERWTDRHAGDLVRMGHEVHLVSRTFKRPPSDAIIHFVEGARGRLLFAEKAERLVRQVGFDAVHDMGDGWFGDVFSPHHGTRLGGFLAGDLMAPTWWRPVRIASRRWLPRYRAFQALEKRQFAPGSFRTVVALSQRVKRDMVRRFGVDPARIEVVYNGVDGDKFRPADGPRLLARRGNVRRSWGFDDRVVFLLVAHNFRLKGLAAAIRALARLPRSANAGLVVVGDDDARPYRTLARRLGVGGDVIFLGNQTDSAPLFQAADVYVQPTFYDPCSLVVLEAMASGLPTITTAANGAGELLEHGRSGFILDDPRDDASLSQFMTATTDDGFRRSAGALARRTAERNTMAANSRRYVELYQTTSATRAA